MKVWQINRSANRLLIGNINLDGFSLANHGQFAKFAKLSCYIVASYITTVIAMYLSNTLDLYTTTVSISFRTIKYSPLW